MSLFSGPCLSLRGTLVVVATVAVAMVVVLRLQWALIVQLVLRGELVVST